MAACEKCWAGAYVIAAVSGRDQAEVYRDLVRESACTPEEQCGEMHLVLDWKEGPRRCRCGKVVAPQARGAAGAGEAKA